MSEKTRPPGKTTIAPDVLVNLAELTTVQVEGVSYICPNLPKTGRLFLKGHRNGGVRVIIEDEIVNIEICVVLKQDVNIRQVSQAIQKEVSETISKSVGMKVGTINIRIDDIDFESDQEISE